MHLLKRGYILRWRGRSWGSKTVYIITIKGGRSCERGVDSGNLPRGYISGPTPGLLYSLMNFQTF